MLLNLNASLDKKSRNAQRSASYWPCFDLLIKKVKKVEDNSKAGQQLTRVQLLQRNLRTVPIIADIVRTF